MRATRLDTLTAQEIIETRLTLGLSQSRMAALLNVSFATISRWEKGHTSVAPSAEDLYRAVSTALANGTTPLRVVESLKGERSKFLLFLFTKAYGQQRKKS